MEFQEVVVWVKANAPVLITAIVAVASAVGASAFTWMKLKFTGSRRTEKNWQSTLELYGDLALLKLGVKRVSPDTAGTEGDAASIYYQTYWSYHYEWADGKRMAFLRSFVVEIYAFYQWETERGLGENLMTQFASAPIPCMGLEERADVTGKPYWVKVPVADKLVEEPATTTEPSKLP